MAAAPFAAGALPLRGGPQAALDGAAGTRRAVPQLRSGAGALDRSVPTFDRSQVRHVIYSKGLDDEFDIVPPSVVGGLGSEAYKSLNPQVGCVWGRGVRRGATCRRAVRAHAAAGR
jgi:hypothetical protein